MEEQARRPEGRTVRLVYLKHLERTGFARTGRDHMQTRIRWLKDTVSQTRFGDLILRKWKAFEFSAGELHDPI